MNNEFCPMTCNYLSITEWDQEELRKTTKVTIPHRCLKYDERLLHLSAHPLLYKCEKCYQEDKSE